MHDLLALLAQQFKTSALVGEKLLVGAVLAILCIAAVSWEKTYSVGPGLFRLAFSSILAGVRLAGFMFFFVIYGMVRTTGDVQEYYYPQAKSVLDGLLPYRDFPCNYGPVFPYLASAVVWVWDSPAAVVMLTIVIEIASVILWLRVGTGLFDERDVRTAALLYLTSLLPIANAGISGQNQVWISFFLGLAAYFIVTRRDFLSGIAFGVAVVGVKFVALLFAPATLASAGRRVPWLLGAAAVVGGTVCLFQLAGADVLSPFRSELHLNSPGNIPFLLSFLGTAQAGSIVRTLMYAVTAILLAAVALRCAALRDRGQERMIVYGIVLSYLIFALSSQKSYAYYAMTCFAPMCLVIGSIARTRTEVALFAVFGIILVVEPNLWQSYFNRHDLRVLLNPGLARNLTPGGVISFLMGEVLLVSLYVYFLARVWKASFIHSENG